MIAEASTAPIASYAEPLCIEHLNSFERMAAAADDWNALAGGIPFRRWEWLGTWWTHYRRRDMQPWVLAVRDNAGALVGLAPWYRTSTLPGGRVIRFLGSGEVYSDYLTVLSAPGAEAIVGQALAEHLAATAHDDWDRLELTGLPAGEGVIAWLVDRLAARQMHVVRRSGLHLWRTALPDTWEQYVAARSRSQRALIRKLERRYFLTGRARLHELRTADDLPRAFEVLVDLHQRRRRSLGQRGCFASQRFARFHRDVAARLLAIGALRLSWLDIEGCPAAVEYDLLGDSTVFMYQVGMEPALAADRPGKLMFMLAIRHAIAAGCSTYDFLRGDEPYKAEWGGEPHPTFDVHVIAPTARGALRHAGWLAQEEARRWARRCRLATEQWRRRHGRSSPLPAAVRSSPADCVQGDGP